MANLLESARDQLRRAVIDGEGILASTIDADNYRKVWSRDSVIAGISGLLHGDVGIIQGLKDSVLTLAKHQHALGIIPSNVGMDNENEISYGQMVGRVDATLWWVLGASLLIRHGYILKNTLEEELRLAIQCTEYWTFNGKGLVYTPISGNWADEYPTYGYTLYDNSLRYLALRQCQNIGVKQENEIAQPGQLIKSSFWPDEQTSKQESYHASLYSNALKDGPFDHWCSSFAPDGYKRRFDNAGIALFLLTGLASDDQLEKFDAWLNAWMDDSDCMLPAFWPIITEQDGDWSAILANHSYDFKNHPGHFHNGGCWPIWNGLMIFALNRIGRHELANELKERLLSKLDSSAAIYPEYFDYQDQQAAGKTHMSFSAAGVLYSLADPSNTKL